MADKPFFEEYGGQSVDALLALEPAYRVDSIVLAFEAALSAKRERAGDAGLQPEERVVLAIEALEREVNNGGYHQFFVNSSREFAGDIVAALEAIRCPRHAEIAKRAIALLRLGGDFSDDAIEEALMRGDDVLMKALGPCDTAYYACPESLEDRLFAFIRANKDKIRIP